MSVNKYTVKFNIDDQEREREVLAVSFDDAEKEIQEKFPSASITTMERQGDEMMVTPQAVLELEGRD